MIKKNIKSDDDSLAIEKIKTELANFGHTISELISSYEQLTRQSDDVIEFKEELLHSQKYLEILIDETGKEVESLKRDVNILKRELLELKTHLNSNTPESTTSDETINFKDEGPQPEFAVAAKRNSDLRTLFSNLPTPKKEMILSSIPPRKLTEDEALELLMAVENIVNGKNSNPPS